MSASLVGSEMCIRDSDGVGAHPLRPADRAPVAPEQPAAPRRHEKCDASRAGLAAPDHRKRARRRPSPTP
eukprot:14280666-Alexandrium_andersonii.AAC.1